MFYSLHHRRTHSPILLLHRSQLGSAMVMIVAVIAFDLLVMTNAFSWSHTTSSSCSTSSSRRRRFSSPSLLNVSELHVPGYAKTKLPFLTPPNTTIYQERTYSPHVDYTSYVPYQDGYLIHTTTHPIFTINECQMIINEAEQKAHQMGWTTSRHGNYPTTDIPIVELPTTLQFLKHALLERIYPLLRTQFGNILPNNGKSLCVADGFIVKYDATAQDGGQTELKPHRDGSILSFNIALNPSTDYDGGGTWFASLLLPNNNPNNEPVVRIDVGQIVTHSSSLLHGGHGITSGQRYIMVCFVILEGYDSWSMRFYNQVRNL